MAGLDLSGFDNLAPAPSAEPQAPAGQPQLAPETVDTINQSPDGQPQILLDSFDQGPIVDPAAAMQQAANQTSIKEMSPHAKELIAFSHNFLDAAVPGQAAMMKHLTPGFDDEYANALHAASDAENPGLAKLGTGTGAIAGGILTGVPAEGGANLMSGPTEKMIQGAVNFGSKIKGGIANMFGSALEKNIANAAVTKIGGDVVRATAAPIISGAVKSASKDLLNLGFLSLESGVTNTILQNPQSFDEALDLAKKNAMLGLYVGAGLKAIKATAGGLRNQYAKIDDAALATEKNAHIDRVAKAEQKVNNIAFEGEQAALAYEMAKKQKTMVDQVIDNAPFIEQKIVNLPAETKGMVDALDKSYLGPKIGEINKSFQDVRLPVSPLFKDSYDMIRKNQTFTSSAKGANQAALNELKQIENTLSRTSNYNKGTAITTAGNLYEAKKQLQGLLYNEEFLKNAPRGTVGHEALVTLDKKITAQLNGFDPTGELSAYNKAYSQIQDAKNYLPENPNEFKVMAADNNLNKRKEIQDFMKGFDLPEDMAKAHPDLAEKMRQIKESLKANMEVGIEQYRSLQTARADSSKLQSQMEKHVRTSERLEAATQREAMSLEELKKATPENILDRFLPGKIGKLFNVVRFSERNPESMNALHDAFDTGLLGVAKTTLKGAARGAVTRAPGLMGISKPDEKPMDLSAFQEPK